jgi:hypothetical protein
LPEDPKRFSGTSPIAGSDSGFAKDTCGDPRYKNKLIFRLILQNGSELKGISSAAIAVSIGISNVPPFLDFLFRLDSLRPRSP